MEVLKVRPSASTTSFLLTPLLQVGFVLEKCSPTSGNPDIFGPHHSSAFVFLLLVGEMDRVDHALLQKLCVVRFAVGFTHLSLLVAPVVVRRIVGNKNRFLVLPKYALKRRRQALFRHPMKIFPVMEMSYYPVPCFA